MRTVLAFVVLALLLGGHAFAGADSAAAFASREQGRAALSQRDDFVARLSPFDRAARLKKATVVAEAEYLEFVRASVLDWSADDKSRVGAALNTVVERFRRSSLTFPAGVRLIHTNGSEEGNAAYTRGSAIVLPTTVLADAKQDMAQVLSHELFHIISRRDGPLRDRLYQSIGFERCPEFVFPAALAPRRITNPDAPRNDHRIKVAHAGKQTWAIPVLFADRDRYDEKHGGEFFDYLQFRFALDEQAAAATAAAEPALVELKSLQGFFEQVGRNTQYLIHPEEILADNFAIAIAGNDAVPSPAIPREMLRIMHDPAGANAAAAQPATAH